jgi:dienelactone hydrolase
MNEEHEEEFDPEAAELGWERALAFLRSTLG